MAVCAFCNQFCSERDPNVYHEIKVWVHGPKRDGATLRTETGKIAHEGCILKAKAGQSVNQPELF